MQYKSRNHNKTTRKPKISKGQHHTKTNSPNKQLARNNFEVEISNTKKPSVQNLSLDNKIIKFKTNSLSKYVNKHKTLERDKARNKNAQFKQNYKESPPYEYKIAFRLKQAIKEASATKPNEIVHVRQVVVKALKEGISWPTIECLLQECGWQRKISKNCFLLEICYNEKVFLLLSIRTNNVFKFKKILLNTLKKYQAKYASVLHYFQYNCKVEALASYKTTGQFANFERNLAKHAIECQAKLVKIIDYETGAVKLHCHPLQLPCMVEELEKKNYKILHTDYGLEAIAYIELDMEERTEYMKFLKDLKKFQEIENYYDNIKK